MKIDQFVAKFKSESGLHLKISAGIFLFVLFFQPFPLPPRFSFNNQILFIAGIGAIIFISFTAARILLPWLVKKDLDDIETRPVIPSYVKGFLIFFISSASCLFYLWIIGSVKIDYYIAFKVILICIAPPVILDIHDNINDLRKQVNSLLSEKRIVQKHIEKYERDYLTKSVEFVSENVHENLVLDIADVAFIRSADNYVEIIYKEGRMFRKKLLRNSLKNIEYQIRNYSNFLRCHRICIVNSHFIETLNLINNNYVLTIKDYDEKLPVSRQYLLSIREAL